MLRSKKRELLLENLLAFAILLYFGYLFYTSSALWKNLILQNTIRFPLILLVLGVSYALVVGEYRHIKMIVTALDTGIPFSHQTERKKNGKRRIGLSVCYLFILFWVLIYVPLSWVAELPEERETATYPAVIRNNHGEEIPVSMGKSTSLLAPKQYTIVWEGEGETLILEWVETRNIRLAQRLADSYPLREEKLTPLQTERFNHAVRSDNPAATKLFLQKGNRFLYIYYLGEKDIGVYLPDLAKFMENEPKNSL